MRKFYSLKHRDDLRHAKGKKVVLGSRLFFRRDRNAENHSIKKPHWSDKLVNNLNNTAIKKRSK